MARFIVSHKAQVKQNRLTISVPNIPEDGEVEVLIVKRDPVTTKQRGYYRGVLLPLYSKYLTDVSGVLVSDEDAHMDLQQRFIPYHDRSTSNLTKEQMSIFVNNVVEFLYSLGLNIPERDSGITYAGTGEKFSDKHLTFV